MREAASPPAGQGLGHQASVDPDQSKHHAAAAPIQPNPQKPTPTKPTPTPQPAQTAAAKERERLSAASRLLEAKAAAGRDDVAAERNELRHRLAMAEARAVLQKDELAKDADCLRVPPFGRIAPCISGFGWVRPAKRTPHVLRRRPSGECSNDARALRADAAHLRVEDLFPAGQARLTSREGRLASSEAELSRERLALRAQLAAAEDRAAEGGRELERVKADLAKVGREMRAYRVVQLVGKSVS